MGDIRVGDELFGFPIVYIGNGIVQIEPVPGAPVSFDSNQFTVGLLATLQAIGSFIPNR